MTITSKSGSFLLAVICLLVGDSTGYVHLSPTIIKKNTFGSTKLLVVDESMAATYAAFDAMVAGAAASPTATATPPAVSTPAAAAVPASPATRRAPASDSLMTPSILNNNHQNSQKKLDLFHTTNKPQGVTLAPPKPNVQKTHFVLNNNHQNSQKNLDIFHTTNKPQGVTLTPPKPNVQKTHFVLNNNHQNSEKYLDRFHTTNKPQGATLTPPKPNVQQSNILKASVEGRECTFIGVNKR